MTATTDTDRVAGALAVLYDPGDVVELRIPQAGRGTVSGYYDDLTALARDAAAWSGRAAGVYTTLNPVNPALLARSANRLTAYVRHTTADTDILRRRWLPIDCDPDRPAGISSTDAEHAAALERAEAIAAWLRTRGWPDGILADSGNGGHLLYRIDLPNDAASTALVGRCLQALDFLHSDDVVKVDRTTGNAARIWKVYGTLAAKGDNTPDRPHRVAQLLTEPEACAVVPRMLLEDLAAQLPDDPAPPTDRRSGDALDVDAWLGAHGLDVASSGAWNGGRKWVLATCPWNPDHTNRSAYVVQFPSGAVAAGCHHNGCTGKGWHDLRDAVEPGWRERRDDGVRIVFDVAAPDEPPWEPARPLPSATPSAPTLPAILVPAPLRPWLTDAAGRAVIPLEMVAVPALVGLGAVVGRLLAIRPNAFDDFVVVANLWGGIVARPGMLKSYAIAGGTQPVSRLAATASDRFAEEHDQVEARQDRLKAEIESLRDDLKAAIKKGTDTAPIEATIAEKRRQLRESGLTERRYVTHDATTEKLGQLLSENPRGLLLRRDELAGWLRTLDKPGREGDREFYLEAWNGTGSFTVDRIGRGTLHIPSLTLSVVGGIQPGKLRRYVDEAIGEAAGADGLLQRLQLLVWPDALGAWKPPTRYPDHAARQQAFTIYEALDRLDPVARGATVDPDGGIPYLRFDAAAQRFYDGWRDALERRLRSNELAAFPAYEAYVAKQRSLLPALALLFHLVEVVAREPDTALLGAVSEEAVRLAADWVDFLDLHAQKVYAAELLRGPASAHTLAAKIAEGAVVDRQPIRDIYRAGWRGLATSEQVSTALDVLVAHGWARLETIRTGGRPTQVIRLHPELHRLATGEETVND